MTRPAVFVRFSIALAVSLSFLAGMLVPAPAVAAEAFRDVPSNHPFAEDIAWAAAANITRGCGTGRDFCPTASVSRGQMAAFLVRALDLPTAPPARFRDVPARHPFASDIGRLVAAGVTQGCGTGRDFCPNASVTRAQMTAMLRRAVGAVHGSTSVPPSPPATPPAGAPVTTPPSTPPRSTAPSRAPQYPGQPAPKTVLWGSSIHGGADPYPRHEQQAGASLALRRTFFQWSHRTSRLPAGAAGDLAAGRLPWVSVKTPSWAAMAAGRHDAEIDQMLRALDALRGPVWLTVHHEPEGGGGNTSGEAADDPAGPAGHLAMNKRVRTRMDALGVDNVALVPVFMAWTFDPKSGRNIEHWWDDGVYDLLGIDIYQRSEGPQVHDMRSWKTLRTWANQKGVDIAVGEWGMRGTDAAAGARVKAWYEHAIGSATDGRGARVVGQAAFDSGLNSPTGSWELKGHQLEMFRALLRDPRTARLR